MRFEMEVKKRQKVESRGETRYQVFLLSIDGRARMQITGVDVTLFQEFKKEDIIFVNVGPTPQTTLDQAPGAHK